MQDLFGVLKDCPDKEVEMWLRDPKHMLYAELFREELAARKGGKQKTCDTNAFEWDLFENLLRIRDALWEFAYEPSRGTAHIIMHPVQREIFAAPYRDRVVHHWIVRSTMAWWEKRFCYDSYSCREKKGTSFGVKRLNYHMRSASHNFSRPVYVIKLDISGYFMHIDRKILYDRVIWGLEQQFAGKKDKRYAMLKNAIKQVIFDDPVKGCKIQGSYRDWNGLPRDKSLFFQPPGKGLVIGNLTSQFCSNIYLDLLDKFVTRELGYHHYGRYVDDFFIVVTKDQLKQAMRDVDVIGTFLNGIGVSLNQKKTHVYNPGQGVPFLGMVVKNGRVLPGKRLKRNFQKSMVEVVSGRKAIDSVASYLGLFN